MALVAVLPKMWALLGIHQTTARHARPVGRAALCISGKAWLGMLLSHSPCARYVRMATTMRRQARWLPSKLDNFHETLCAIQNGKMASDSACGCHDCSSGACVQRATHGGEWTKTHGNNALSAPITKETSDVSPIHLYGSCSGASSPQLSHLLRFRIRHTSTSYLSDFHSKPLAPPSSVAFGASWRTTCTTPIPDVATPSVACLPSAILHK